MTDRLHTRFLVIGTGVAGLHTAWRAAQGVAGDGDVLLLTKRTLFDSATTYAQGGIAAALGAGDSPALHRADTLAAGAALCDADAVQVLVEEGPSRVRELQTAGAAFDLTPTGEIMLGREAAHSRDRIVHARGDQTGAEVARTLIARVRGERRIQVLEHARVLDLVVDVTARGRRCAGVRAAVNGRAVEISADATVLATGGCGQVYRYTTNPLVATGDGYAIAHRAGAQLADMEFVQFHPTALDTAENPLALISEAVRGEGAQLLNAKLERFMPARHADAELAPRDVVARAIFREQQRTGRVWLDARTLGGTPGTDRRTTGALRRPISGDLRALHGTRDRSGARPDPGHAGRALHDGRSGHRPGRTRVARRALGSGRGGPHGGARREPAGEQLAARRAGVRGAGRAGSALRAAAGGGAEAARGMGRRAPGGPRGGAGGGGCGADGDVGGCGNRPDGGGADEMSRAVAGDRGEVARGDDGGAESRHDGEVDCGGGDSPEGESRGALPQRLPRDLIAGRGG